MAHLPAHSWPLSPPWVRLHFYNSLDSTQREAVRMIAAGEDRRGEVFWAASQSAGHGRQQRVWVSDAGGLYLTAVLPELTAFRAENFGWYPLLGALACAELMETKFGVRAEIKWPNDVLVGEKKVAGLLGEIQHLKKPERGSAPVVILGMGVNWLNEIDGAARAGGFSATRLADSVAGLNLESRRPFVEDWLGRLAGAVQAFAAEGDLTGPFRRMIESRLYRLGSSVTFEQTEQGAITGEYQGLAASGAARVRLDNGSEVEVHCGWQAAGRLLNWNNF